MSEPARSSVYATASIAAVLTIPAVYAILRGYDVLFKSEPNPATVIWSARIAMFWRLGVGAYVAGMVLPLAYFAARADLLKTMRVVAASAVVIAALVAGQGLLLP